MDNKRNLILCLAMLVVGSAVSGQDDRTEWSDPGVPALHKAAPRSEFISYDIRDDAVAGDRDNAHFFRSLTGRLESPPTAADSPRKTWITLVSLPYMWLDRESFLHVEGVPGVYVYMNDAFVGYGEDSRTPSEFDVSKHVREGVNTIRLEVRADATGAALETAIPGNGKPHTTFTNVYLYSQPKLRIENFSLSVRRDSLGKQIPLWVNLAVSSTYNHPEAMTVGYDIYNPLGKLVLYDMRDLQPSGHSRDTVRLKEILGVAPQYLWSAENPALYRMVFFVRRSGRSTEYIPFKVGFGETDLKDGKIYRNGSPIDIRAVSYNAAADLARTEADLNVFKTRKYNTVCPDYPQPLWFYDLCDRIGLYVIDQANINSDRQPGNRGIGGTYANDPRWLPSFLDRVHAMHARNRERTCIIGWSLGGNNGNGYAMYKAYQLLKSLDPHRAVVYRYADGEWNSDIDLPVPVSGAQVLREAVVSAAEATATPRRR